MTIYLAHDGTVQGDWISHYAIQLAQNDPAARLHFIHITVPDISVQRIDERVRQLEQRCRCAALAFDASILPLHGSIVQSIYSVIPAGSNSYLLCGTRILNERRGILTGTVAESLLVQPHCHVLALRIVQPGILGLPRRVLVPVSGHPRGFRSGVPFLGLFAPDITHLDILYVQPVSRYRFRRLTYSLARQLRIAGNTYCEQIESEIARQLSFPTEVIDNHVVVSDDVSAEIVLEANRAKSRLIYMGASERSLRQRFFSGHPVERVLRSANCDVAVYRGYAPANGQVTDETGTSSRTTD